MNNERDGLSSGLSTGIEELDNLLLGGIPKGSLVEIHGPTDAYVSTLCHQLATQMSMKGLRTLLVTADGSGTFHPGLLRTMATRFGIAPDVVVSKFTITNYLFISHLLEDIHLLKSECSEGYGLIVIDSASEFLDPEDRLQKEYQQLLGEMGQFAKDSDIICIASRFPFPDTIETDYRFRMKRTGMNTRRIELMDRPAPCALDMRIGFCGFYHASSFDEAKDMEVRDEMISKNVQREVKNEVMI